MAKLLPLGARFSEDAHKKILSKAAEKYLSKSEYVRQLVLTDIGMLEEINMPKTNAGYAVLETKQTEPSKTRKTRKKLA